MNNEEKTWQDKLIKKYPELLKHTYPCVQEGWYNLLDIMLTQIQLHVNYQETAIHDNDKPRFVQIKEKFGGLRAYHDGGDAYIAGIIEMTESMSYHLCECCGNKGKLRNTSWLKTLCDKHYSDQLKK